MMRPNTMPTLLLLSLAFFGIEAAPLEAQVGRFYRAHEPEGMTTLSERPFSSLVEGWSAYEFDGRPESIVHDSTAPFSPPSVMQFNYRAGRRGGNAQGNEASLNWGSMEAVYVYVVWKIDPNWQGHDSGVNKQFFLQVNNPASGAGSHTFFDAHGTNGGQLRIVVQGQRHCCGEAFLRYNPNVGDGRLTRGRWHELEFLFVSNTPGVRDGRLRVWKDGEMTHDYSNFGPLDAREGPGHRGLWWSAIWGGTRDEVRRDQWIRLDHVYVSGR